MLQMMTDHVKKLPVFMAHGDADPVVAFENARASVEVMRNKLGFAEVKTEQVRTLRISAT